jgi:hypothetical protein
LPVQETLLLVWLPENGHSYQGSKTAPNDNENRAKFLIVSNGLDFRLLNEATSPRRNAIND